MAYLPERFSPEWVPDTDFYRSTINLLIIFKASQTAVRKATLQSYRANVMTYMLARLSAEYGDKLNHDTLWEAQSVSPEFGSMLREWAALIHEGIVAGAGSRNVTEFCKKEECWERIRTLQLPTVQPPPIEFQADQQARTPVPRQAVDPGRELIDRCMALNGADWTKIVAWASTSTTVTEFDLKVAHTVSGYALAGWQHEISEKQARIVSRVLDAAERAGILEAA